MALLYTTFIGPLISDGIPITICDAVQIIIIYACIVIFLLAPCLTVLTWYSEDLGAFTMFSLEMTFIPFKE